MLKELFKLLGLLLIAAPTFASHTQGVFVDADMRLFDFAEFDDSGSRMVSETGWVYGANTRIAYEWDDIITSAKLSLFSGAVRYDGHTQAGVPHQTTTVQAIEEYEFTVGKIYDSWSAADFVVIYGGLGLHRWERDIKNKGNIAGQYELYQWGYLHVGAEGFIVKKARGSWMVQLKLLRSFMPNMYVKLKTTEFGGKTLKLGSHYGARLALPYSYHFSRRWEVRFEPYFEAWELGRSPHYQLDDKQGYTTDVGIHEPRSSSHFYGFNIGALFNF